jgi:hypothetical protein
VIPSMPGFGFSTPLVGGAGPWPGRSDLRHADAPARYESYGTHGSDGGAMISRELAVLDPPGFPAPTCCSSSRFLW